ncbi:MAG: hypothetical protein JHD33_08400 [Chthoniobacterales bacterium]|nr:hypothetical protein [Chthoniobacterales bacterium]
MLCFGALALAGCQTTALGPAPEFAPDMVVAADYALFYRLGPQQAGGADLSLRTNENVMLLRKEFGYSRVQLEDGQVGYMANEDIQPAPEPPPEAQRKHMPGQSKKGGRSSRASDEDYEENIPIPDPNLGLLPDDIPLEPLPDLLPEPGDEPAPAPAPQPAPLKEGAVPEGRDAEPAAPVSTST